jgi:flagellar hook-associated protein 2
MEGGDKMSGINSLYGGYSNSFDYSSMYVQRSSKWRGGVTGWEPKVNSNSPSSSTVKDSPSNKYLSSVKEFGAKINQALTSLTGNKQTTIFDLLKGMSSNENALSVNVKDQSAASAFSSTGASMNVSVKQLATAQQNRGQTLSAGKIGNWQAGSNQFSITKGDKTYDFNVNVNATDSNRTVQEKMAASINKANAGITATVVYNEKDKTSSLMLTSKETGEKNAFEIQDVSGNLVEEMNVGSSTTTAQDAIYTVDGEEKTSSANEVDLGNGFSGTLKQVTGEDVTVTGKPDSKEITNSIYDLVNGFNQLRETAVNNNGDSGAKSLQNRLDSISSAYKSTLARVGITQNKDGYLVIDEKKLGTAIENGQAESVFGEDSGFTRSLSTVANNAENRPGSFLSYSGRIGSDGEEPSTSVSNKYDDWFSMSSFTPNQINQLDRWDTVGMLFSALA